jgi:hypothetical protein
VKVKGKLKNRMIQVNKFCKAFFKLSDISDEEIVKDANLIVKMFNRYPIKLKVI